MSHIRLTDGLWARLMVALLAGLFVSGCGGGGGGGPAVTIAVTPTSSSLPVQGSQAFTATVVNTSNRGVTWTVQEGAAGGSITPAGVYTAPATVGTDHAIATSQADASKSATVAIVVHTSVAVSPGTVTVLAGHTQTFTATVLGSSNTAVTWNVVEGASGGTISAAGVYTAPNTPGAYHVTATSQVDSTVSPQATVTDQGGNIQGTIQ